METLQIQKGNALDAFNNANDDGKKLLQNLFGKQVFDEKITDRVKTFDDARMVLGIKHSFNCSVDGDTEALGINMAKKVSAFMKLLIIAKALNEGWEPDYENGNQAKYYPYFMVRGGFAFYDYDRTATLTHVGSRLCFKSAELAQYAGKQFESLYKDYLM